MYGATGYDTAHRQLKQPSLPKIKTPKNLDFLLFAENVT